MDRLLADLDRFASTPTGSLTLVLLTALIRLVVPAAIKHCANRHKAKKGKAANA